MVFQLYYNTTHDDQKEIFLLELDFDENNILHKINDIVYAQFEIISFEYSSDKYFIVNIKATYEEYDLSKSYFDDRMKLIENTFPKYIKRIILSK